MAPLIAAGLSEAAGGVNEIGESVLLGFLVLPMGLDGVVIHAEECGVGLAADVRGHQAVALSSTPILHELRNTSVTASAK